MMVRRYLAHMLACSALLTAMPIEAEPKQTLAEAVEEVSRTAAAGDGEAHLAAYRKLAALLAKNPEQQNMLQLIDLQRDIARAAFAVGADGSCSALDQGMAYLGQARAITARSGEAIETVALDVMERQFAAERIKMRCIQPAPPAEVGMPDASLVGHYYLSGVMETGSELLLKADGRFEWYISYGSVDQMAKGRWGRAGETVSLEADTPSVDAPLFRADEAFPWEEAAERQLRENERKQIEEMVAARCPWNVAPTSSLWSYDLENPQPAGEAKLAKASEAKRTAEAARDDASRIIAKAAAASASDDVRDAADAAMDAWYTAQFEMALAHHDANLPEPDIGSPAMPPECQLPADESYGRIPETQWRRGVAVLVGDPASGMGLSGVEATFVFDDGHRKTARTRGGFAFVPVREGAAVQQIVLALSEPVSRTETLSIKPLAEGVLAVIVDRQQIVGPAFSIMRLEVKGKDLIPQDMRRGRYSRN